MIGRRLQRAARAALAAFRGTDCDPPDACNTHGMCWPHSEWDDPGVDVDKGMPDYSTHDRGWMQTVTGKRFYPLNPRVEDVDIYDIAHGLAMCCRYAGHTKRFYSVAEHCVHVSREVERYLTERVDGRPRVSNLTVLRWALLAHLHDSAEAYIGDMIRPLKHQPEMMSFRVAEARIESVVLQALGFGSDRYASPGENGAWNLIKSIDDRIILDEINALKVDPSMYADVAPQGGPLGVRLQCWAPEMAREHFMRRYKGLRLAILHEDMAE